MSHTPGPWEVAEPGYVDEHYAVLDGFGHTASVYGYPEEAAQALANARLIAAAPELLAALKEIADECERRLRKGEDSGDRLTLKLCKYAIAKAEGRGA